MDVYLCLANAPGPVRGSDRVSFFMLKVELCPLGFPIMVGCRHLLPPEFWLCDLQLNDNNLPKISRGDES